MRVLTLSFFALLCFQPAVAHERPVRNEKVPLVSAGFGMPARFDRGTLQYPGFTVRLAGKTELFRSAGQRPWTVLTFEVLKDGHLTIGGDIVFNSEERANGRRFDVGGKIYIAEMYYSTAGLKDGETVPLTARLVSDEIVIWDEAAAKSSNVSLAKIWEAEHVEPGARYFVRHAYSGGVLLSGFLLPAGQGDDARNRLKSGSLKVERVAVLDDNPATIPAAGISRAYGERSDVRSGVLQYPDLAVALVSRMENHPVVSSVCNIIYKFRVYLPNGDGTTFHFDDHGLANGYHFKLNGSDYFAEMFSTTAIGSAGGSDSAPKAIPLLPNQIVIWDHTAARTQNSRILKIFAEKSADASQSVFAGAEPIGHHFTGTSISFPGEVCAYDQLDAPLRVLKDAAIRYPARFNGSGYVGYVYGFIYVEPDGTVIDGEANYGSDNAFEDLASQAIRAMRFTMPKRNGQPVKARLRFSWSITEQINDTASVNFEW